MKKPYVKKMNRRGVLSDFPFIVVFLIVLAISMFLFHRAYTEMNDGLAKTNIFANTPESQESLAYGQTVTNGWDFLFVMGFFLFGTMLVISAFLIDTHPVFFFLSMFLFVIVLIVGAMLANITDDIKDSAAFSNTTATYPMTSYIIDNFVLLLMLVLILSVIVFYAKARSAR